MVVTLWYRYVEINSKLNINIWKVTQSLNVTIVISDFQ